MATASAPASNRPLTAGYFKVPNSFAENQAALIPAERALAIIVFRRAGDFNGSTTVSDRTWEAWTGLAPRQKEYAIKGLRDKGLNVDGRGDTAKFSWDWPKWNEALKHRETIKSPNLYPERKGREAKPGAKVHEDCFEHGCSKLRECQANTVLGSSLLVMPNAQCTAQTPKSDPEVKWIKTIAAMRSEFASAGVELLMKLLTILWAIAGLDTISDYVLAEAVKTAYTESRGRWNSPVLLLSTVPNVLKGWKAKGQPMDDTGEDEGHQAVWKRPDKPDPELPRKKRARDLI